MTTHNACRKNSARKCKYLKSMHNTKYSFINVSDFQSVWGGQLGCIIAAKHHSKKLENYSKTVYGASYRAGPKK